MLDSRHMDYVRWIAGLADRQGLALLPVRDADGALTDHLELELEHATCSVFVVVPYPPAEWELARAQWVPHAPPEWET